MTNLFAAGTVDCVYPRPVVAANTVNDLPDNFLSLEGSFSCCFEDDNYKAVEIMGYHENNFNFKIEAHSNKKIMFKVTPRYSHSTVYYHTEESIDDMIAWLSQNTKATLNLEITVNSDQVDFISRRDGSVFYKQSKVNYQILIG